MVQERKQFRAAVIGLGFIGAADQVSGDAIGQKVGNLDGTHAQALAKHPMVQLVSGSSRDEGRRKRFEQRLNVGNTYSDWREMLAAEKLDIVSIATNTPFHAEIAIACAEAGVGAILCEKPIATRLIDADRAIQICRQRQTLLAVNHNRRWHPYWCELRDEIRAGAVGRVHSAYVQWPTGRLGTVGTHWFDLLRMLLGSEATAVSATLDPVVGPDCRGPDFHDPGGWGIVAFAGGLNAFVQAGYEAKLPFLVHVVGSDGQITARPDRAVIESWSGSKRELSPPATSESSVDRAVDDIVQCLTNGTQPACTGEDGLAALEIIIGFHVSDRLKGQWVQLPIRGADRDLEVRMG
jgi:predicted dehydrogenase